MMRNLVRQIAHVRHPGLTRLRRFQTIARLKMTLRRIATPRRMLLTSLAAMLSVIWLGQTVISVLFRPAADPQRLAVWIPAGFLSYAIWNVIKTTCRKPIEPFEWTPAERELLIGAPLLRQQLVQYRLSSIVSAGALKALCFSLVMLPDIHFWSLAFVGMLMALTFLDLLRMVVEVVVWGVTRRQLMWMRAAVLTLAVGASLSALVTAYCLPASGVNLSWPAPFGFALSIGAALLELRITLPGLVLMQPFQLFGTAILASSLLVAVAKLSLGALTILLTAWLLMRLDGYFLRQRNLREKSAFNALTARTTSVSERRQQAAANRTVPVPRKFHGAYSLFWRQLRGMVHYRHSLALSFLLPGFLSLLPLFGDGDEFNVMMQVVGSLVFYSFVLLPAALRFDFRRDVERMAVIKALPISPAWTALGQLAGPVLMCTLFQIAVLLIAMAFRPYHPATLLVAVTILLPVNALIFCVENLIFMLFPYRMNQEGISVFLRSILTFTAKGMLFVGGLVATLGIAGGSAALANQIALGSYQARLISIFTVAMWLLLIVSVAVTFSVLASVYRRFDPSQDTPAMS